MSKVTSTPRPAVVFALGFTIVFGAIVGVFVLAGAVAAFINWDFSIFARVQWWSFVRFTMVIGLFVGTVLAIVARQERSKTERVNADPSQ